MIECKYAIYKQADRAVCIGIIRKGKAMYIWLPKSQIAIEYQNGDYYVVGMKRWLARSKGLPT